MNLESKPVAVVGNSGTMRTLLGTVAVVALVAGVVAGMTWAGGGPSAWADYLKGSSSSTNPPTGQQVVRLVAVAGRFASSHRHDCRERSRDSRSDSQLVAVAWLYADSHQRLSADPDWNGRRCSGESGRGPAAECLCRQPAAGKQSACDRG